MLNNKFIQDNFIYRILNYINNGNDEEKYIGKQFFYLLADKINSIRLNQYIEEKDFCIKIKKQYKNILIKIKDLYIFIVEDEIEKYEHDNQINKFVYQLVKKGVNRSNIFTCYYKIYDEYSIWDKKVNIIITRKDIITFLEEIKNKNEYINKYYEYLTEIEEYSKIRNMTVEEIEKMRSDTTKNIDSAIYTSFYHNLEDKEKDIIGWKLKKNKATRNWCYSSKKYNNVKSNNYSRIYAEINLKRNINRIYIKLEKKKLNKLIDLNDTIENFLTEDYLENKKLKYYDKKINYLYDFEKNTYIKKIDYDCYKIINETVDIFEKVITQELLNNLEKFNIYPLKKENNRVYKYYSIIASININNYTLEEIEEILNIINKHLEKIIVKIKE